MSEYVEIYLSLSLSLSFSLSFSPFLGSFFLVCFLFFFSSFFEVTFSHCPLFFSFFLSSFLLDQTHAPAGEDDDWETDPEPPTPLPDSKASRLTAPTLPQDQKEYTSIQEYREQAQDYIKKL